MSVSYTRAYTKCPICGARCQGGYVEPDESDGFGLHPYVDACESGCNLFFTRRGQVFVARVMFRTWVLPGGLGALPSDADDYRPAVREAADLYADARPEATAACVLALALSDHSTGWFFNKDRTHLPACIDWLADNNFPLQTEAARGILVTLDRAAAEAAARATVPAP